MKAMGEHREAFRQIFFLGHDRLRQLKLGGREIPNALDAGAHHQFGGCLARLPRERSARPAEFRRAAQTGSIGPWPALCVHEPTCQ